MSRFIQSKMYRLIVLLSDKEFSDFGSWLRSTYLNSSKKLVAIHKIILKSKQQSRFNEMTKQELHAKLYPGKGYKAGYLNNLIRGFVEQLEKFLIWNSEYLAEHQKLAYFTELRKRGEKELFFKDIKEYINSLEENDTASSHSALLLFQLSETIYYHSGNDEKYDSGSEQHLSLRKHLEVFFLEKRLALLYQQYHNANLKKHTFDKSELELLAPFIEQSTSPAIRLYLLRLYAPKSELDYQRFLTFYGNYLREFDRLPNLERHIFLLICINDAVRLITQGDTNAKQQLMNLYKFGIEEKLLLTPEVITSFMFNNIVSISIQLKEIDFLQDLIWQYANRLPELWRKDAITWAEVNILFSEEKFINGLEQIKSHHFSHWLYRLQIRIIETMILFELFERGSYKKEAVEQQMKTFKKFVERNKKKYKFRAEPYLSFIKICQELLSQRHGSTKWTTKSKKEMTERIKEVPQVHRRVWLLHKTQG